MLLIYFLVIMGTVCLFLGVWNNFLSGLWPQQNIPMKFRPVYKWVEIWKLISGNVLYLRPNKESDYVFTTESHSPETNALFIEASGSSEINVLKIRPGAHLSESKVVILSLESSRIKYFGHQKCSIWSVLGPCNCNWLKATGYNFKYLKENIFFPLT